MPGTLHTGGSMRRRMFNFSRGSNKPMASFPPEDRSRYYDFVDTPVRYRPESPLIERQEIPVEAEAKLRCACMLLFYYIKTGQPSGLSYQPAQTAPDRYYAETHPRREELSDVPNEDGHLPVNGPKGEVIKKEKYDSGVELDVAQPEAEQRLKETRETEQKGSDASRGPADDVQESALDVGIKQFYEEELLSEPSGGNMQTSNKKRLTMADIQDIHLPSTGAESSHHLTTSDIELILSQPFGAQGGETEMGDADLAFLNEVPFDFSLLSTIAPQDAVVRPTSRAKPEAAGPQEINAWVDSSAASLPCRAPSFSRPKPASKRIPRAHGAHSKSDDREAVAVIIDVDGVQRAITAAEEQQRRLDLQRAVMEKMSTGTIARTSTDAAIPVNRQPTTDELADSYLWDKSGMDSVVRSQPGLRADTQRQEKRNNLAPLSNIEQDTAHKKKAGLIRKLSVLGMGKKKTNTLQGNRDMSSFSRIVKAS